jgi:hypothetical protein
LRELLLLVELYEHGVTDAHRLASERLIKVVLSLWSAVDACVMIVLLPMRVLVSI